MRRTSWRRSESHKLRLERIIATHAHFDHLLACRELQAATGAPFYLHPDDRPLLAAMRRTCIAWLGFDPGEAPVAGGDLTPGEIIHVGDMALEIRHTPGHSPGSVTLVDPAGRRAIHRRCAFRRLHRPHRPARRQHGDAACEHPRPDPQPA